MAVQNGMCTMNIAPQHGMEPMYWYPSGLYCRTPISESSIME